ncbi:MAG: 2-phosphosulfolactate phosphatase [Ignavibacteria bacterium]|nr:2-phosphosulfolactate phosphatase [Ignavibacteria bacterium]
MKVELFLSPNSVDELHFTDRTVVVIDVLRATTSIISAMENGAGELIPVASIEFAMKMSNNLFGGKTLLAGERNGLKIDGFNLGNSPLEFTREVVNGKSIILFTTNGSKAIAKTKFSEQTMICSFTNISAVAELLLSTRKSVTLLCSGSQGLFSLEDTVCAGMLAEKLLQGEDEVNVSDSVKTALVLARKFGDNIGTMLKESEHGRYLMEKGFTDDLSYCAEVDRSSVVPIFLSNAIKAVTA